VGHHQLFLPSVLPEISFERGAARSPLDLRACKWLLSQEPLIQISDTRVDTDILKTIAIFSAVVLTVFSFAASYGLELGVGFF
jgi:hypothetical protein